MSETDLPAMDMAALVQRLRDSYATGRTRSLQWRRNQLHALRKMLVTEEQAISAALHADLGKSPTETYITETGFLVKEIDHTLRHLKKWLRPERISVPAALRPASARVIREPLGVVLVISPWNYPVQLLLAPIVGALAAGNCVVGKPSELAPATSRVLSTLVPRYLDSGAVTIVEGAIAETTALLAQRFDHIFYTGNATVGRIVMTAAAQHLTPVTLELGGKSPVFVDSDADLATAARRIVWSKFLNAGQTCVAPDYLLADPQTASRLEPLLAGAIIDHYGPDPSASLDYGRIVSKRHFDRLVTMLTDGRVVAGADHEPHSRYIAPTVLADVSPDATVMREEIFGPILPILTVSGLDEAIAFINAQEKPLSLYAFGGSANTRRRILEETSSGAVGFGLPAAHLGVPGLPFGGVGQSGIGAYHGRYSIDTFSHRKAVLRKPLAVDTMRLAYPPHTTFKARLLRLIT